MGLTNDPNIPVPALANEAAGEERTDPSDPADPTDLSQSEHENEEPMKPEILAALGLEEGATPEEVLAKITELQAAATAAATEKAELETAKADAEAKTTEAENELATAKEQIVGLENSLSDKIIDLAAANERAGTLEGNLRIAANAAVQSAVEAGRITPAEAEAKAAEVLAANDFEEAIADLGKMPAKFKTTSQTGDLGSAKSRLVIAANDESTAAREERARLVANEYEQTDRTLSPGERKRIAWRRASAKNPDLFAKGKDSSGTAA